MSDPLVRSESESEPEAESDFDSEFELDNDDALVQSFLFPNEV